MGASSSVVQPPSAQTTALTAETTIHHHHFHFHYHTAPSVDQFGDHMAAAVAVPSSAAGNAIHLPATHSVGEWRDASCYLSPLQTRCSSFASISSASFPPDPWQHIAQPLTAIPNSTAVVSCSMTDAEQVDVVKKVLLSHVNLQANHFDLIHNPIFLAAHYNLVEVLQGLLYPNNNNNCNNNCKKPNMWRQALDISDAQEFSPLYIACYKGHSQVAKFLLDEGVDVNHAVHSFTPLYVAAKNGHVDTVQLLLDYKADIMLTDGDNNMPYDITTDKLVRSILYKAHEQGAGICAICWQEPVNASYTFLPCNHNILCKSCNRTFRQKCIATCPMCRSPIWCRVSTKFF